MTAAARGAGIDPEGGWSSRASTARGALRGRPAAPIGAGRAGRWIRVRFQIVAALLALMMTAIGFKAYGLQVERGDHFRALAERQQIANVEVPAPRGGIFDVAGRELAATADVASVSADPGDVVDVAGTAERLAETLGLDARDVEAKLAAKRHFVWIERHVTDGEAAAVRALDLPGVRLTMEPRRYYPGKALAGPVLGFAGIDGKGLAGLELTMDDVLTGARATVSQLRDASGKLIPHEEALEPRPGASVYLTIDRTVQFIAERALAEAVATEQAKAGVAVVLDVATGAVLAMASAPSLDPNGAGRTDPQARNRAVTDVFEIGSVMKTFTVAAALDAGVIEPDTTIDCEGGELVVSRHRITDTHEDHVLPIAGVIKRSSNVGSAKIALRLGAAALHRALKGFGFGGKTGIELSGEEIGLVRAPGAWRELGLATIGFGYGLSVTPLQVVAAYAALGNGGVYHAPHLIDRVVAADGRELTRTRTPGRRVVSAATAAAILPMLAGVFDRPSARGKDDGGTAGGLTVDGFRAGGKTGTAHKVDPTTGTYGAKLYVGSFAGLAPIDAPRIAVIVVIDEPSNGKHYGGQVAGPAWATIVSDTLRHLGAPIDPTAPTAPTAAAPKPSATPAVRDDAPPADDILPAIADPESDDGDDGGRIQGLPPDEVATIPDFRGLGIARALELAHRHGVRLTTAGSGRVLEQVPPPGRARKPAECHVVLGHGAGR